MAKLVRTPNIGWRQLAILDAEGGIAVHHGDRLYSIATEAAGDHVVAIGNILANDRVTAAMLERFEATAGGPLEDRLLAAMAGGRDAGGEILEPLRSAALRVSGPDGMDRLDLRVDRAEEAVAALTGLRQAYGDQEELLRQVAFEPDRVPVARSLFDASVERIGELGLEGRFDAGSRRGDWTFRD